MLDSSNEPFAETEAEGMVNYDAADSTQHRSVIEDEEEDDSSSQLSIPNESIDFDLVYSLRNFVATTEGQANVHKGDTLFLMDDSNSYWWLVRVLKTQDIGYIPAENIETPIERLARLNKHRNVDLASATPAEQDEDAQFIHARRNGGHAGLAGDRRSVVFTGSSVYYYPPFVWGDPGRPLDDMDHDDVYEEDDGDYPAYEDADQYNEHQGLLDGMEPDDGMSWEDDGALKPSQLGVVTTSGSSLGADQSTTSPTIPPLLPSRTGQPPIVGLGRPSALRERPLDEHASFELQASLTTRDVDPVEVVETRKLNATPFVAREYQFTSLRENFPEPPRTQHTLSMGSVGNGGSGSENTSRKSFRDDADSDADSRHLRGKSIERKLKKERFTSGESRDSGEGSDRQMGEPREKKKVGFLGGLFGRKRDKKEIRSTTSPTELDSAARSSAESVLMTSVDHSVEGQNDEASPHIIPRRALLEEHDAEGRFARYLTESEPSSTTPPQVTGFPHPESAQIALSNLSAGNTLQPPARGARPGSLIISSADGLGAAVPELSVLRVFAGDHLQSEATFKTVLINASTTTAGLMRQAMQRFRLPEGEDPGDYYLTIKQVDGDEALLLPDEYPLQAFGQRTERATRIPPKRASMGSINSLASNLSMSITKLGMNDFTDDSTVKLYLHRTVKPGDRAAPMGSTEDAHVITVTGGDKLPTVMIAGASVSSVPSTRFAVQIYIYPEELPDGMVFDPHTEAIVPRSTLQHRSGSSAAISPGVSQTKRRKVFVFPKNTTVAEVIEASLERFGILEGVVEGGDDVEDKPTKRRSSSRVRYGLNVLYTEGQQRELQPSSKVLDAFIRAPLFKTVDRRSSEWRRRSMDSAQLMGTNDDIQSDDPIFILRKVVGTRNAKGKNAGPLDELALRQMHRESASSDASAFSSSVSSQGIQNGQTLVQDSVTVKQNIDNGVDIITQVGVFRSQRRGAHSPTYTLVTRSGEVVDIGPVVLEEFGVMGSADPTTDLLHQATMGSAAVFNTGLGRIQGKVVKTQSLKESVPRASVTSPSICSETFRDDPLAVSSVGVLRKADSGHQRDATLISAPSAQSEWGGMLTRAASQPPNHLPPFGHKDGTQPSTASVASKLNMYTGVGDTPGDASSGTRGLLNVHGFMPNGVHSHTTPGTRVESGITNMLSMVELRAAIPQRPWRPELSILDQMLIGTSVNLDDLHPQAREFFARTVHDLEDINKQLGHALHLSRAIADD